MKTLDWSVETLGLDYNSTRVLYSERNMIYRHGYNNWKIVLEFILYCSRYIGSLMLSACVLNLVKLNDILRDYEEIRLVQFHLQHQMPFCIIDHQFLFLDHQFLSLDYHFSFLNYSRLRISQFLKLDYQFVKLSPILSGLACHISFSTYSIQYLYLSRISLSCSVSDYQFVQW